jgi:nucleotide-binding universal stress UspA family protein
MIAIKNVLVATDFSDLAQSAVNYGRELARTGNGTLHVLHVADDIHAIVAYADMGVAGMAPAELQEEIERAAARSLEASVDECDRRELHALTVLRVGDNPAKEIVEYARTHGIDLIVIGATGRGALNRMIMGSVADKVVRQAPCPVLAIRHPEREFLRPDALQAVGATVTS